MSRKYSWTLPNYTDEQIETLKSLVCRYICFSKEISPTTGTPHLQGFTYFDNAITLPKNKNLWFNWKIDHWGGIQELHLEVSNGSCGQNRGYCRGDYTNADGKYKELNPWFFERGDCPNDRDKKRNKSQGPTREEQYQHELEFFEEFGHFDSAYFRLHYRKLAQELYKDWKFKRRWDDKKVFTDDELKPWQKEVLAMVLVPPNDRNIIWVVDIRGNQGKSALGKNLQKYHDAQMFKVGKVSDLAHSLVPDKPIYGFDFPRSNADVHLFCGFIENMKDGDVFSGKYDSVQKVFATPHIIIFANNAPPDGCFTEDRLKIINI